MQKSNSISCARTGFPGFVFAAASALSPYLLIPEPIHAQARLDAAFIAASRTKIDSVRKRNCKLTITNSNGSAAGLKVKVKQIRNHFGFGAAIGYDHLNSVPGYAENFLKYYEWAVFENDMKWPSTDPTPNGPDYAKSDSLIRWCKKNDIKVRGHNLFWNQQEEWFPTWTLSLNPTDFKSAVDKRITDAMGHFKGKVDHWDIVNEIIHGSVLQDHSGDPNIIHSIYSRAKAIDSMAKLTVNDFNILVWNSTEDYIANIRNMLNAKVPIDIVGCEGHFGDGLNQDYAGKLERVASLNLPIWITEMDFSTSGNPADEFERLMRTFFGHPKVEGVMMWVWWGGNKWRAELNSHVVDTNFTTTPLGNRFLQLRKEWSTVDSGQTDAMGSYSFRGYHGKYEVTVTDGNMTRTDTLYLEPAVGGKQWNMALPPKAVALRHAAQEAGAQGRQHTFWIRGMPITFIYPETTPTLDLFTPDGNKVASQRLTPEMRQIAIPGLPSGKVIYRIRTESAPIKQGIAVHLLKQ